MKTAARDFEYVLGQLKGKGLLLMTDARLPNAVSLLAGEPVRGSWWGHSRAQHIFVSLGQLEDHKDVLFTRFVAGKVTLVHRRLWRDLVAIASARERWQVRGLSSPARHLARLVTEKGLVQSDQILWPARFQATKIVNAARELELRLLIHSGEVHTKSGAHAKVLETWQHWVDRVGLMPARRPVAASKRVFERLLMNLNAEHGTRARLPWQASALI